MLVQIKLSNNPEDKTNPAPVPLKIEADDVQTLLDQIGKEITTANGRYLVKSIGYKYTVNSNAVQIEPDEMICDFVPPETEAADSAKATEAKASSASTSKAASPETSIKKN